MKNRCIVKDKMEDESFICFELVVDGIEAYWDFPEIENVTDVHMWLSRTGFEAVTIQIINNILYVVENVTRMRNTKNPIKILESVYSVEDDMADDGQFTTNNQSRPLDIIRMDVTREKDTRLLVWIPESRVKAKLKRCIYGEDFYGIYFISDEAISCLETYFAIA